MSTWDVVFLIGFVTYVALRARYEQLCKSNVAVCGRTSAMEVILLVLVGLGSLALPVLYLFTPWIRFADYAGSPIAPWFGLVAMAGALWLFWRAHADLGRNWSATMEIRQDHELVTRGVYRRIRHPMYASIFAWSIAQRLLLANWLAGWSALWTFGLLYAYRVRREEQLMIEQFGGAYEAYIRSSGRLWPRITKLR